MVGVRAWSCVRISRQPAKLGPCLNHPTARRVCPAGVVMVATGSGSKKAAGMSFCGGFVGNRDGAPTATRLAPRAPWDLGVLGVSEKY